MSKTETPFMDYVKKRKSGLKEFEETLKAEEEQEEILPQPDLFIEQEEGKVTNVQMSFDEDKKHTSLAQPHMIKTTTKLGRNPDLHKISNLRHHGRIYFDKRNFEDYLYIFHSKKPLPKGRIKLDKANLYTLFAYCIAEIYGEKLLKQKNPRIWITRKLEKKIREILTWRDLAYAQAKAI